MSNKVSKIVNEEVIEDAVETVVDTATENVTTDVLLRICNVLECDISEIVECVNDSSEEI